MIIDQQLEAAILAAYERGDKEASTFWIHWLKDVHTINHVKARVDPIGRMAEILTEIERRAGVPPEPPRSDGNYGQTWLD